MTAAPPAPPPGLVVAAPASGSGKTVATLGLLRAFRDAGLAVGSAKAGPDYIDPRYHAAASGRPCPNLDGWSMRPAVLDRLAAGAGAGADLLVVEGAMGLFDGATRAGATSDGSTADLAARFGWPVALVVDARAQAQSAAALVRGFRDHRPDVEVAGVVLNRVAGARHEGLARAALEAIGARVFGAIPRDARLALPSRHLGLLQAGEHKDLERFLDGAASAVAAAVDLEALRRAARPSRWPAPRPPAPGAPARGIAPLGQRIAIARDAAFGFAYGHVLDFWRAAGAEVLPFSPLADEAPAADADAVFLPGGYPELHAGRIAAAARFLDGLRRHAGRGATVYGECGGYMALGAALTDAGGAAHRMAGLLDLETGFAAPRPALGYRLARARAATPLGPAGTAFRGHEFHYAATAREPGGEALFDAEDAAGATLPPAGLRRGAVFGSFLHLVDRA